MENRSATVLARLTEIVGHEHVLALPVPVFGCDAVGGGELSEGGIRHALILSAACCRGKGGDAASVTFS